MTLASSRSRDSSPRASSAVDCRASGEAGATARERQHTHAHTWEKTRVNTTEHDRRRRASFIHGASITREALQGARASERDGCARRDARRFFSRGDRALCRRETRRARNETASIASSTMRMKFKKPNDHRRLTTTTTTRAGAAETIIGRGWRRETRYARSTRRRAMRCATRRERPCARSGGEFQIIFSSTPRRRAKNERGRDRDATRGRAHP